MQCLCLHPPWAHWGHGTALPLDDAWGRWRGQELLSLLAGCADGAFYGIILGWDQQEALGLLNVPGTLTITQLLPHCWGLEPGLGQPIQGQPFWPLAQGWTSPSRLMGAVGIHIPLCPWVRAASPALGAAFGIPLASPHLLRRAPAEPAHKGQLHECHGSPCCWSPAPGPWCHLRTPGPGSSAGASLARSALPPAVQGCCWLCLSWLRWAFSCM